jgi:hypothetical protein
VSPSRTTLALTYPSEPILSEAAAHITGAENGYLIGVGEMLKFVRTHQLNTGDLGELVARLLCLSAVDSARMTKYGNHVSKPVSVLEFLKGLVHSNYHRVLSKISSEIARSVLNFNHFIIRSGESEFKPDLSDPALRRCAAFSCKPLQRGIDLAIPVLSKKNKPSFIFIQVKNVTSGFSNYKIGSCLDKMRPENVFDKDTFSGQDSFLKLVFLFDPSESKKRQEEKPDFVFSIPKHVNNLVLSGLQAFNIDSKLLNVMEPYLSTPGLIELVNDGNKNFDIRFPLTRGFGRKRRRVG